MLRVRHENDGVRVRLFKTSTGILGIILIKIRQGLPGNSHRAGHRLHLYSGSCQASTCVEPSPLHSSKSFSALHLLRHTAPKLPSDFAGLGIVLYDSLMALPHLQLEVEGDERFDLPVQGLDLISDVLTRTARLSSSWHDGFHFVHAGSASLTHLCQFIAPPLPRVSDAAPRASGARHMTALLASRVTGIVAIGLLTHERAASIYEAGRLTWNEIL